MSRWTEFIKDWAKKNNMSYGCAMSDTTMKEEYYKKYPKTTSTLKPTKPKPEPKKAESKKVEPVKKPEEPKKEELTEMEKIRKRVERIGLIINPGKKDEFEKLKAEREKLREKLLELLKKKLEETKKKETKGKETKGKETKGKETKGKETKGKVESKLKKYRYSFDITPKEVQDDYMEMDDLVKKNKELLSNVYIGRPSYFKKNKGLVRDMNFLRYLNIRSDRDGRYTLKEKKQSSSHFLSQTKEILKLLKNLKVGGGEDNDKVFKIRELKILVPVKT